ETIYRLPLEIIYKTVSSGLIYRDHVVLHINPENINETVTIMQKTSIVFFFFLNNFFDPCLSKNFPSSGKITEYFKNKENN
ncbi:MAG: hypothetical protein ACRCV7_05450, partial [Culicoidibacterales bacterium]